jgi:hypothetical protein
MSRLQSHARRTAALAAGAAALAVAATVVAPSVFAATGPVTLHFREPSTNASAINAAGKANRQGDYLAWDDPLKDATTGAAVGRVAGVCTLVDVKSALYDCAPVTYTLADGTIYADGFVSGMGKPMTDPIVGGTGKYQNVRGTLTVTAVSATITDHVLKIDG